MLSTILGGEDRVLELERLIVSVSSLLESQFVPEGNFSFHMGLLLGELGAGVK